MSENLTISQLAKELNVSRQKIYRFLDKPENSHIHEYIYINSKKIKMINDKGVQFIKENINRTTDGQETDSGRTEQKVLKKGTFESNPFQERTKKRTADGQETDSGRAGFFIKQIEQKDTQIHKLQQIIEKNQNLLDQQQRLALQDKKLLEEYKSEINELKALKKPQEDMKEDSSIRGEAQEEIERLKAQLKLSEEERNKAKEKEPVKTESKKWWQLWK